MNITELGKLARKASYTLSVIDTKTKNNALLSIADALDKNRNIILDANEDDIKRSFSSDMPPVMRDRLKLDEARINSMIDGIKSIAALNDPVGSCIDAYTLPNGLTLMKERVPLGVIGIIYESRPNVTVDAAALCLKAGNAVILRGGSDAISSNKALADIMRSALDVYGLKDAVALIEDTSRQSSIELMQMTEYLDVLIPRGGAGLIRSVVANAKVPVIETGVGNCHVYIDNAADLEMGAEILFNAKCSRPSVCNAAETLLVARSVANKFLPMAKIRLDEKQVELRGCPETKAILGDCVKPATEDDYYTEYNDYILAVKVVQDVDEAIEFINTHSTHHSEAIVTRDYATSEKFLKSVDSAAVYVNASTRFTDGGEFGLGAEIGISTQKMHARGPMGVEALTSMKYIVRGNGQVR